MVIRYCKYLLKHLTVKKHLILTSVSVKTELIWAKTSAATQFLIFCGILL